MANDGGVNMDVGPKRIHFVTVAPESGKHRLHVNILRDHATLLGIELEKKSFIGRVFLHRLDFLKDHNSNQSTDSELLDDLNSIPSSEEPHFIDSCSNKVTEIFVHVWISNCLVMDGIPLNEADSPSHSIPVACTERFLSHYELREDDVLFLQQGKLLPLSRIVISVKNSDAFMWLQRDKFSTGMMLEVCHHDVLLRKHDIFLGSYSSLFLKDETFKEEWYFDMTLSECFPLKQGILTVNTSIILCDDSQSISGRKSRRASRIENLYMSQFCRQLSECTGSSRDCLNFDVDVQLVDQEKLWRQLVCKLETKGSGLDTHSFLGLPRLIMKRYGLFDGAVVDVSLAGDTQSKREETAVKSVAADSRNKGCHCAIIKCLSQKYDSMNNGFVSPLLIFNLKKLPPLPGNPTLHIQLLGDLSMESDVDEGSQSMSIMESVLPIAAEVHISIILSPNYSPGASYAEALRSYFLLPRVMSLGDVFALRSSDDPEFWQNVILDTGVRLPVMFFKVTRVECDCEGARTECQTPCVIDATCTKLLQVGSVHSYIPQAAYAYLEEKPASYWSHYDCSGLSRYRKKLASLLLPHLTRQRGGLQQQLTPSVLLCGPVGCGKATIINAVARRLCLHVQQINCHDICGESAGATESRIKNVLLQAGIYTPCIVLLKNIHVIGKERDGTTEDPRVVSSFCQMVSQVGEETREYPLVIVATTHATSKVSADMHEAFLHHINVENPTEGEREDIILSLIENDEAAADISISHIAQRTAGFLLGDLVALVAQARRQAYIKVQHLCKPNGDRLSLDEEESIASAGVVLEQSDFESALDILQAAHSDAIGAPKIPNVSWSDVGGLASVKQDILDTIQLPLQHPELLAAGLRRSGVLLYGPPGTGKTLLAKAVATECSLNFLSVKGPELINMYVGQSEANVREVFKRARSASPCVIFFDELDSLAPNRGRSGDSGGVMDRVVSQLLAELDGLHKSREVFVIGATNRPDLLDPALLRPGRFDKLLYLGLCTDHDARLQVLKAICRKFHLDSKVDLDAVVDACPEHMTGADFYALCSDTMLNAIKRKIQDLDEGKEADQSKVVVEQQDFDAALADLVPSVTEKDLIRYRQLQQQLSPKA